MKKNHLQKVQTDKAPAALGPYSQAVVAGNLVFCSGQLGLNAKTNNLVKGGAVKETNQALKNLRNVLKAADLDFEDVVRVDIFLTNMDDFVKVNEVYAEFFKNDPKPARQTVEVNKLPKGASIEISCIAYKKEP